MYRALLITVLLTGCYSPELADCAVVCQDSHDCAGDQGCIAGWCTASGTACSGDASNGRMITLETSIMGKGKIVVANVGECTDMSPDHMCTWMVPTGTYQFDAVVLDKPFEKWISVLCTGQGATCTVPLLVDATVGAKFK